MLLYAHFLSNLLATTVLIAFCQESSDPITMKADLHTHSHFSDGAHSPGYVVERAIANGVTHLALTDHDCLEGYLQAAFDHRDGRLSLIPGVEISTSWENQEIHVLGLCFDPEDRLLIQLLEQQQQRRCERLELIESKLTKAGITGLGEFIRELPCVSPGRAHVARFLHSRTGTTAKKAFRSLARNGRFHVRGDWCSLTEAVAAVRRAGGIAVIAHPHRYPLNGNGLNRLLTDFRASGGEAMEICCSSMTPDTVDKLAGLSLVHKLWVTAGSDFHSSEATWMDIGRLRQFPESVRKNAIWSHHGWHYS